MAPRIPPAVQPTRGGVGGLVLAGGQGRRFGRPKADVVLGGITLVERAVELLRPFCVDVVVASRQGVALPSLDARVVPDPGGCPSAITGLASGLDALDTTEVVVVACDLVVAAPVIERLLAAEGSDAVASDEQGTQPLCARYRRRPALAACRRLLEEGDLRARRLVDLLAPTAVHTRPGEVRNMNTWLDAFAAALDVPALSPEEVELVLDLTREVAHGTERLNGPVASFLAGLRAAERPDELAASLRHAIETANALLDANE